MQAINVCLLPQSPCWEVSFTIRLTELYEPVLFRSLTAVNARVRRHAVIVFTDCFPLGSSESRESYSIEEQFKSILVEPEGMIDR